MNFKAVMRHYSLSSLIDVSIAASEFIIIIIRCQFYMVIYFIILSDFRGDGLNESNIQSYIFLLKLFEF